MFKDFIFLPGLPLFQGVLCPGFIRQPSGVEILGVEPTER